MNNSEAIVSRSHQTLSSHKQQQQQPVATPAACNTPSTSSLVANNKRPNAIVTPSASVSVVVSQAFPTEKSENKSVGVAAEKSSIPLAIKTPSASSSLPLLRSETSRAANDDNAERSRHERVHHEESEDQSVGGGGGAQATASLSQDTKTLNAAIADVATMSEARASKASESKASESKANKSLQQSNRMAVDVSEKADASESKTTTRSLAMSQSLKKQPTPQNGGGVVGASNGGGGGGGGVSQSVKKGSGPKPSAMFAVGDAVLAPPAVAGQARDPKQVSDFLNQVFDQIERSGTGKRPSTLPPRSQPDSLAASTNDEAAAAKSQAPPPTTIVLADAPTTPVEPMTTTTNEQMYVYVENETDSLDARPRIFQAVRNSGGSSSANDDETYKLLPMQIESFDEEQIAYHNKKPIRRVLRGLHVAPIEFARTLGMRRTSAIEGRLEERKDSSSEVASQPVHGVARIVSSLEHLERCLFYEADANQFWRVRWSFCE